MPKDLSKYKVRNWMDRITRDCWGNDYVTKERLYMEKEVKEAAHLVREDKVATTLRKYGREYFYNVVIFYEGGNTELRFHPYFQDFYSGKTGAVITLVKEFVQLTPEERDAYQQEDPKKPQAQHFYVTS